MKNLFSLFIAITVSSLSSFGQYKDAKSYQQMHAKSKANHAAVKSMEGSTGDCDGAIVLCGGVYTEETAPPGSGNTYEFTRGCNNGTETMSLW